MFRRQFLALAAGFGARWLGAATAAFGFPSASTGFHQEPNFTGGRPVAFTLPPLPYPNNALEPHIDGRTMEIHHDKHHGAYVTNLNKALESAPDLASKSAEEIISNLSAVPEAVRTAVRNNGGGHVNHSFFWKLLTPQSSGKPSGK